MILDSKYDYPAYTPEEAEIAHAKLQALYVRVSVEHALSDFNESLTTRPNKLAGIRVRLNRQKVYTHCWNIELSPDVIFDAKAEIKRKLTESGWRDVEVRVKRPWLRSINHTCLVVTVQRSNP